MLFGDWKWNPFVSGLAGTLAKGTMPMEFTMLVSVVPVLVAEYTSEFAACQIHSILLLALTAAISSISHVPAGAALLFSVSPVAQVYVNFTNFPSECNQSMQMCFNIRQIDPVDHNAAAKMATSSMDASAEEWKKGADIHNGMFTG